MSIGSPIYPLIDAQIPEHLRTDSPAFGDFLKTYYKYADQRNKASGLVQYRRDDSDIDECSADYISEFYATYGKYFPQSIALDRRNLIKILNQIYDAKGTQKSLELLFAVLFADTLKVSYPGEQRLRTSDGTWVREKFVTLETQYGTPPSNTTTLTVSNSRGDFVVETTRMESVGSGLTRFYFLAYTNIHFDPSQKVFVYDASGVLTYIGTLVASPAYLSINDGGTSWIVGQIINITGTVNTIARVKSIDAVGAITGIEILQYGYGHTAGQITTTSPYPNKPVAAAVDYSSVLTSITPVTYTHTLTIQDYVDAITESLVGVSDGNSDNSYVSGDYVDAGYFGYTALVQSVINVPSLPYQDGSGLTIGQWLDSRATLTYMYSDVVSTRGYYVGDGGQLSNQNIRLQDNYFYQPFSYLIETTRDISEYESILNVTHPAGTKRFSSLSKISNVNMPMTVERTLT